MTRKRRKDDSGDSGAVAPWMNTYADMVTLLLCFFVLLFSFATIDAHKFEAIVRSLQGSLGVLDSGLTVEIESLEQIFPGAQNFTRDDELDVVKNRVELFIKENQLENNVTLILNERGLLIRMLDATLFDSGKAEIREESKYIIGGIADVIKKTENYVRIEGHTDNVPINTFRYPSNWELSTARAVNVLKYLIENHDVEPERLSAVGYGEYHPIDTNETPEGRQNNRRVDIMIIRTNKNGS